MNADELKAEEEQLRIAVRNLSEGQRIYYTSQRTKQLKDPDTYAALNWFFLVGLHHMYLGQWLEAAMVWIAMIAGFFLLITGENPAAGLIIIGAVAAWETWALFTSQNIVRRYNLQISQALYHEALDRG